MSSRPGEHMVARDDGSDAVAPMDAHPIQLQIANLLGDHRDRVRKWETAVQRPLQGTMTPTRLLALAAPLLAHLAEAERLGHMLEVWLPRSGSTT